jgi:LAO/AO transport system kinase
VIGFTGPPGVGKSTLLTALTKLERARGRSVAVLSIDPSSPFTKGALLGDRIRLSEHFLDPGVFIRSMANRGALGGLAEATLQAVLLMDGAGRDVVLLETVGVGQAEVDIIDHADTVVLVLMPGSGDSIQALKAGVMEIPDVIVVNKADHPLTDTMVREIRGVLSLGPRDGWQVPVLRTEAANGAGVQEVLDKLAEHRAYIEAEGTLSERRRRNLRSEVLAIATYRMRRELEASIADDPSVAELLDRRRGDPGGARESRVMLPIHRNLGGNHGESNGTVETVRMRDRCGADPVRSGVRGVGRRPCAGPDRDLELLRCRRRRCAGVGPQ